MAYPIQRVHVVREGFLQVRTREGGLVTQQASEQRPVEVLLFARVDLADAGLDAEEFDEPANDISGGRADPRCDVDDPGGPAQEKVGDPDQISHVEQGRAQRSGRPSPPLAGPVR